MNAKTAKLLRRVSRGTGVPAKLLRRTYASRDEDGKRRLRAVAEMAHAPKMAAELAEAKKGG